MKVRISLGAVTLATVGLWVAPALAQDPHAGHAMQTPQTSAVPGQRDPKLPPDNTAAKEQLASSARHGEWVDVRTASGPVNSFVVYPERSSKAPVVVVVHDIVQQAWPKTLGFLRQYTDGASGTE